MNWDRSKKRGFSVGKKQGSGASIQEDINNKHKNSDTQNSFSASQTSQLTEDESRFFSIYQNSSDAIILMLPDGRILAANPAACFMFDKSEAEICEVGRNGLVDLSDPEQKVALEKRELYGEYKGILRLIRNNGTGFLGEVTSKVYNNDEASRRIVVMIRDVTERKQTEEQLCISEKRYRSTLDNMLEGCQIIDRDWRYVYLNDIAVKQSHFQRDELIGHTMFEVYKGIESTELFQILKDCMENQEPYRIDNEFVFPDGEKGYFELFIEPVPEGLFILSIDITARKHAEEQLRSSREILSLFVEYAPAAIAMFDRDMRYLAHSQRFLEDYHIGANKIIGLCHYDVFPEIPEKLKEVHRRCLSGSIERSEAEPFYRQNGDVDWVRWETRPWHDKDGQIGGIMLFSEVITEQKRMSEALAISEQRWKFALEGAGDGVWDWDLLTNEIFFSHQCKSMLGYDDDEIGNSLECWEKLIHPIDKELIDIKVAQLIKDHGSDYTSVHRLLCKDGSYKWVLDRGMVVSRTEDGTPLRLIGTHADIDHFKNQQVSLQRMNRSLRMLSHCNDLLVRSVDEQEILDGICNVLVKEGNYPFVWVGFKQDDGEIMIRPAAYSGNGAEYLKAIENKLLTLDRSTIYNLFQATSYLGRPYFTAGDLPGFLFDEWLPDAKKYGYSSFIGLDLSDGANVLGALLIYTDSPDSFDADEIKILTELANDLAYGITTLRLQKEHQAVIAELMVSENKFRTLFETASEGIMIAEISTRKLKYANPSICKMLGYSSKEMAEMIIDDMHPPDMLRYILSEFHDQVAGIKLLSLDMPMKKKDGTIVYVDMNSAKATIDKTEVMIGFATDTSARRAAEEERKEAASKLLTAMTKTVELISKTVELRDPYTAGHQDRVTHLAEAIARELGLSANEVEGIHMAAIVHDLGKMYIPSEILSKPGHLNDIEFALIKTHSKAGYNILKEVEFPWPIAEMVLQHHERLDGSGYPDGLKGSEITIGARIIAVADVVEAMASHRPYRPALGVEQALEEITINKGRYYDEDVVEACAALFRKGFVLN